jgi:hypothetical protein
VVEEEEEVAAVAGVGYPKPFVTTSEGIVCIICWIGSLDFDISL